MSPGGLESGNIKQNEHTHADSAGTLSQSEVSMSFHESVLLRERSDVAADSFTV